MKINEEINDDFVIFIIFRGKKYVIGGIFMLYLVKIFYAFIIPPGGIISLLILFNIYLYWKKIKGKYILSVITLLFYLLSTNFIAYHLVKPLENFYQNKSIEQLKQDKNDVIIMLGGGAINVADIDGEGQVSGYVANRMITVMRLQKELDIPIILSGGKVFEDTGREADIEKRIFEGMGVDSKYLILENQSRNTVENVQNSKVIMEEYNFTKPLVITSGFHLPRAMEIFAREGIEATPYVADYQMSDELVFSIFNFLPNNGSLNTSCMAIREYLGILALKLKMQ